MQQYKRNELAYASCVSWEALRLVPWNTATQGTKQLIVFS